MRGGFELFSYDYFFENINQAGCAGDAVLVTNDNGLTFTGANPRTHPERPAGAAGRRRSRPAQPAWTEPRHVAQPDRDAAYYRRWEAAIQHDWGGGWMTSFTHIGSRGVNLPVARQLTTFRSTTSHVGAADAAIDRRCRPT